MECPYFPIINLALLEINNCYSGGGSAFVGGTAAQLCGKWAKRGSIPLNGKQVFTFKVLSHTETHT